LDHFPLSGESRRVSWRLSPALSLVELNDWTSAAVDVEHDAAVQETIEHGSSDHGSSKIFPHEEIPSLVVRTVELFTSRWGV